MKNKEYYKNQIFKLVCDGYIVSVNTETQRLRACKDIACDRCVFNQTTPKCAEVFKEWLEREHVEPVLTDEEKQYLETVIRPFKDRAIGVTKYKLSDNYAWLYIDVEGVIGAIFDGFSLPAFRKDDAYLDMEYDKKYTLEELGLFEDK